jgi:hypothetical protein
MLGFFYAAKCFFKHIFYLCFIHIFSLKADANLGREVSAFFIY